MWGGNVYIFCDKFIQDTIQQISSGSAKFYVRYDENILAYFLLGTGILIKHDFHILLGNVETLVRWGGKHYNSVDTNILRNMNTYYYDNRSIFDKVNWEIKWWRFVKHTVQINKFIS